MHYNAEDDEVIAKAMLLGCEFYSHGGVHSDDRCWVTSSSVDHPLEVPRNAPWPNRIELAREYVAWCLENS